jgi:hypothetical protein
MSTQHPTQSAGDKAGKALVELSELHKLHPDKSRKALLQQVETKYDLTPKECEFLNRQFQDA